MPSPAIDAPASVPAPAAGSAGGHLEVSVRDEGGLDVLGNTVIVLRHLPSGQTWRELRYRRRLRAFVFDGLPAGAMQLRLLAVGYESCERTFLLGPDAARREEIALTVKPAVARLEFDVSARRSAIEEIASAVVSDDRPGAALAALLEVPVAGTDGRVEAPMGGISTTCRVAVALAEDDDLVDALSLPMAMLSLRPGLVERVRSTILDNWDVLGAPADQHSVVGPLVQSRLRLYLVGRAVFRNEYVRTLATPLSDDRITAHLIAFLDSLDSPDLDGVMPLLTAIYDPDLVPVESFLRAALPAFPVRVRPGVAIARTHGESQAAFHEAAEIGPTIVDRAPDGRMGDRPRRAMAAMFTIMRLAELVAATVHGHVQGEPA
jgi:hypothetical protein